MNIRGSEILVLGTIQNPVIRTVLVKAYNARNVSGQGKKVAIVIPMR